MRSLFSTRSFSRIAFALTGAGSLVFTSYVLAQNPIGQNPPPPVAQEGAKKQTDQVPPPIVQEGAKKQTDQTPPPIAQEAVKKQTASETGNNAPNTGAFLLKPTLPDQDKTKPPPDFKDYRRGSATLTKTPVKSLPLFGYDLFKSAREAGR